MNKYRLYTTDKFLGKNANISIESKTINKMSCTHCHEFFEIEVVLDGYGTEILNGNKYEFKKGYLCLMSPIDFHSIVTEKDTTIYNIMFSESLLSRELLYAISKRNKDNNLYLDEEELDMVSSLCKLAENEYLKTNEYKNDFLRNLMECLLIIILRKLNIDNTSKNISDPIQNAILYIKMHFRENPSLKNVADYCGFNQNYFSQRFSETMKKTYSEYLTELKISYAKKLLSSSNMNITEICFSSGFNSVSNFMRVFRKTYGTSPALYRKQLYT